MSTTLAFRLILGLLVGGVLTFSVWDRSYTELEERPTDEDTRTGMPRFRSFAAAEMLPTMLVTYLVIGFLLGGREMAVQSLLGLLRRSILRLLGGSGILGLLGLLIPLLGCSIVLGLLRLLIALLRCVVLGLLGLLGIGILIGLMRLLGIAALLIGITLIGVVLVGIVLIRGCLDRNALIRSFAESQQGHENIGQENQSRRKATALAECLGQPNLCLDTQNDVIEGDQHQQEAHTAAPSDIKQHIEIVEGNNGRPAGLTGLPEDNPHAHQNKHAQDKRDNGGQRVKGRGTAVIVIIVIIGIIVHCFLLS